ncbi:MAG TPA: sigma-70 family RNA polymerase sigma factor [Thermoanaerobaculia bacterium]|nr:sigma-70 family RNA polymerase sigma factor [Thermoanaerobaculia bacterium]
MEDEVPLAMQTHTPTPAPGPPPQRLEALFQEHGRSVFRTALRVTGSESDAEDVVQTVFLRLLDGGHLATLEEEAGGYLRRAASNAALDVLRRRKTSRAVPLEGAPQLPDDRATAERLLESRRLRDALRRGLGELNERGAEVFTLRHIEGLSNGEIAELLGTSAAVVAVTLHRARRTLQKHMRELAGDVR